MSEEKNELLKQNEIDSLIDSKWLCGDEKLWLNTNNGLLAECNNFKIIKEETRIICDFNIFQIILSEETIIEHCNKLTILSKIISIDGFLRKLLLYIKTSNWNEIISAFFQPLNYKTTKKILSIIKDNDYKLYKIINDCYNSFNLILYLQNISIQTLLREVDMKDLSQALKNESEKVLNKFKTNMSKNAIKYFEDELNYAYDDEEYIFKAKRQIKNIIRRLEQQGDIVFSVK